MKKAGGKKPRDYAELLRAGHWFGGLPAALQDRLLDAAVLRQLATGERAFSQGDASDGIYGLIDGAVRASTLDVEGVESLFTLVTPPMWFGEISVIDGEPRGFDATAERDTLLVHVPQAPLAALLDKDAQGWRHLARLLTGRLRLSYLWIDRGEALSLTTRLARRLLLMAEGYGEWHDRSARSLAVTQEQLAGMLNASRQSVNHSLKELEDTGALKLAYRGVEIGDLAVLRRLARG